MKIRPTPARDLQTLLRVAYLHFDGRSQQDIGSQLQISPSTVSRLIARARDYVELRYNIPTNIEQEGELLSRYPLLRDVRIVETGSSEQETKIVGQEAARYFLENVGDGARVTLSCGETLLEMLKELPSQRGMTLSISQMSAEGDPSTIHQAPAALVGQLRAKVGPESSVYGIQLPPPGAVPEDLAYRRSLRKSDLIQKLRANAKHADFAFVGVGGVRSFRTGGTQSFLRAAETATGGRFSDAVTRLGIMGEINNRPYDSRGQDCTEHVPGLSDGFITILDLADIRSMASDPGECKVVAVATGLAKLEAIRVAVTTGLCNVLITGADIARGLIEGEDPMAEQPELAAVER